MVVYKNRAEYAKMSMQIVLWTCRIEKESAEANPLFLDSKRMQKSSSAKCSTGVTTVQSVRKIRNRRSEK